MNPDALHGLIRLCVQLDGLHRRRDSAGGDGGGTATGHGALTADGALAPEALVQAIIGKTMNFLLHSQPPLDLWKHH